MKENKNQQTLNYRDQVHRFGRIWTVPETVCGPEHPGMHGVIAVKPVF